MFAKNEKEENNNMKFAFLPGEEVEESLEGQEVANTVVISLFIAN